MTRQALDRIGLFSKSFQNPFTSFSEPKKILDLRKFLGSMEGAILGGKLAAEVATSAKTGTFSVGFSLFFFCLVETWGGESEKNS